MNEKIKSPSGQGGAAGGGGAGPPSGSGGPVGSGGQSSGGNGGPGVSVPGGPAPPNSAIGGGPPTGGPPAPNNGSDQQQQTVPHAYGPPGSDPAAAISHYHLHQQPHPQQHLPHQQGGPGGPGVPQNPGEHSQKDEYGQSPLGGPPPPPPGGHHPVYGRYHHPDPNIDPYRYGHSPMQQPPPGGKPQQQPGPPTGPGGGIASPSRPPQQRYIPGQPPQGPTPTLNSLLQSSHPPPPPQHRYANSYDPQQQQQQQVAQQQQQGGPQGPHGPPPPPHQPYGAQQGWAPPPRPYSPQLGPSQAYRTPPPTNTSRGQSPYPPAHGQNSGSYPSSPQQQPGGPPPPPPQSSNQGTAAAQYSPYPQRYPTPPGPATGPNHRTAYSQHQYPEPNRPWPGGTSPAPSPGPGGHPHPPASPHQSQHGGPPPSSSPGHAPSPSPQPSQASPSPHQELIGQNSNDSSSGGAHSGMGSGPPGTPNSQQVMRPTPSPTGSSGSRSMSPAVAQNHPISRPSSNQSSSGGPMQQPGSSGPPPLPHMQATQGGGGPQQQQLQQQQQMPTQPQSQQQSIGGPVGVHSSPAGIGGSQQQVGGLPPGGPGVPTGPQQQQQQPPPPNQGLNSMQTQPPQGSGGGTGGYPPPPHMHGVYKMGGPGQSPGPGPQGLPTGYPPPQQSQQYSQGTYPPRPQYTPSGYAPTPPPSNQPTSANSMPPGGGPQYPGRPMPNHTGAGGPHAQYPPYQNWVPPSPQGGPGGGGAPVGAGAAGMGNHVQGKGTPPPGGPPQPPGGGSPRPLNYLKQHLQHKGGYGSGPAPQQGYGNGPGMHPGMPMGPPHHMGPPHGPTSMGPPTSTPPQTMGGVVGPGGVGPGGSMVGVSGSVGSGVILSGDGEHISQDNGISSSGSSTASGPHPVTSLVTTGPDGTPIDEVSQQSTLSNASAASGEDPQCTTPKSRKNDPYSQSHLAPPSTSPVGHPGHPSGPGEEYEMNSPPNWTRTPASPQVFNSHVPPQETFRTSSTKKSDSLCKLYEMDDNPERRSWLDKLRAFMEERRTPITACPTISKQPLDLYRLYIYVKERGGFVEVCKVTKSKTWKDIAGLLGIGASSSAAYTLRKHYTKNLLTFECHFDRGDIDPLPIIQQVEAGTKKKSAKAASVPSPAGSSNSQDSFPAPGAAANASIDGYPGYPGGYPGTTGPQPDYGAGGGQMQRPPSQSNAQTPHAGNTQTAAAGDNISVSNPFDDPVVGGGGSGNSSVSNAPPPPRASPYQQGAGNSYTPVSRTPGSPYPGQPGAYGQYGSSDQYNATGPPGQFGQSQGPQFPPQNRNMYPPYGPEGEAPPPGANQYGPYGNRSYSQPPPGSSQTPTPPGSAVAGTAGPPTGGPAAPGGGYPPGAPTQQDYYRPPDQTPQPRRHPDFVKDSQPYPAYNTRPQMYGGWSSSNQFRGQYPSAPTPQAWGSAPPRTAAPPGSGPLGPPNQQASAAVQWEQHRYAPQQPPPPPQQQPPYQQQSQQQQPPPPPQWAQMAGAVQPPPQPGTPGSALRPAGGSQQQTPQQRPGMPPPPAQQQPVGPTSNQTMTKPPFVMPPPPQVSSAGTPACGPPPSVAPPSTVSALPPVMGTPVTGAPKPPVSVVSAVPQLGTPGMPQVPTQQQPPQPQPQQSFPTPPGAQLVKKEIVFPSDSVEATTPVLYRRKRLTKADVCPVDPWRIFMAMRSGLLTECTWALDVLNVLLFDDTTVQYFGLAHLPGLLTLLLEHFQKNLAEMFHDCDVDVDQRSGGRSMRSVQNYNRKRHYLGVSDTAEYNNDYDKFKTSKMPLAEDDDEDEGIDLGQIRVPPNPEERITLLSHTPNYTMMSRKGLPVRLQSAEDDIFITNRQKEWDSEVEPIYEQATGTETTAWSWTYGFADRNAQDGIIDVFKSEIINIPFARYIRGSSEKSRNRAEATKPSAKSSAVSAEDGKGVVDCETSNKILTNEPTEDGCTEDSKLQHTFNKKRRLFNNSNSNSSSSKYSVGGCEASGAKKSKLQDDEAAFAQPGLKKELADALSAENASVATDSDCREVDMEIELLPQQRLANGGSGSILKNFDPMSTVRDAAHVLQRRRGSTVEEECYTRDEASLYLVSECQDALARRCICLSNIFRNLTFVPGNETLLAKSRRFLAILGRLLLLNHEHLQRTPKTRNYDREEDTDFSDSCSSLQGEREWWWDYLVHIRENMLVALANIAGHLELSRYDELIARPLIDGLLHWAVCPSAHGQDPFPSCGPNSSLSPQRLALEALCKLCVTDANVDLVIATPPHSRLEKLCAVLTRHLCRNEDQVLREFSVNLLHYLAAADSAMARTVALQSPCISYLVAFIEQAEQTALGVANQHGINYLRENPDSMGTSLDMLRRAAGTLLHLAKHPDNRSLFMHQEQRLLGLVMSNILDQQVALIISRVLFQVSRGTGVGGASSMASLEYRFQQRQAEDKNVAAERHFSTGAISGVDVKAEVKVETVCSVSATAATATAIPSMATSVAAGHIARTLASDIKREELPEHATDDTSGINANCNSSANNHNISENSSDPAPIHKLPLSATAAAVINKSQNACATVDDNSNSSNALAPAAALLNDVSNSSTNSNSCGTVSSNSNSNSISSGNNNTSSNMHIKNAIENANVNALNAVAPTLTNSEASHMQATLLSSNGSGKNVISATMPTINAVPLTNASNNNGNGADNRNSAPPSTVMPSATTQSSPPPPPTAAVAAQTTAAAPPATTTAAVA
ncbi:trithorax group protein osa isoform X3 [Anastrepha ludens]|uniref:trithorax group protein osa isoform X3 n=1 Tax=Anastrepha ludens TaxID=28586 RepID=UPI0023B13214|nr:trithorax group protein osa isoform X3 [Anastrepha ludens]